MASDKSQQFGEFDLINQYFLRNSLSNQVSDQTPEQVLLGIGDDCALLAPPPSGHMLAVTSDMLIENRHFFSDANPKLLGHKCLAVNLSDLAAMGAKPVAFTLSIALPQINHAWLSAFSAGLHALSDQFACPLIGGDTTSGPLTISITAIGYLPKQSALKRSAAKVGDDIWVSGEVGDARYALGVRRGEWSQISPDGNLWHRITQRMDAPLPRVDLGIALRGLAHAAVDISDGLLGDLQHILKASQCNAVINVDQVPVSTQLQLEAPTMRRLCSLRGGDDYELCFTAPSQNASQIETIGLDLNLRLTKIGSITEAPSDPSLIETTNRMTLLDQNSAPLSLQEMQMYLKSFDHFDPTSII
jgi:thiamine-monophosphate kinase